MFLLHNSINDAFGFLGSRVMAPKFQTSLDPSVKSADRSFIQEHMTLGTALAIPTFLFGMYQMVVGFGANSTKEKIGGGASLGFGLMMLLGGHLLKSKEKQEIKKFLDDYCKENGATDKKISDLVLDKSILKRIHDGICDVPNNGVLLHLYGQTNMGKSHILNALPEVVDSALKIKLSHDVKVTPVKIDNKFLEQEMSFLSNRSPEEKFKIILKHYADLAREANKDCEKGDIKEVFCLQIEESSGLLREGLKVTFEDFKKHCPGVCVGITSNSSHLPGEFSEKRGIFNVHVTAPTLDGKVEIVKRNLKDGIDADQVSVLLNKLLSPKEGLEHDQFTYTERTGIERAIGKIDPYDLVQIALNLNQKSDNIEEELLKALQERIRTHISNDGSITETITDEKIHEYLKS